MDRLLLLLHSTGAPTLWAGMPDQPGWQTLTPVHVGYPPNPPLRRDAAFDVDDDVMQVLGTIPKDAGTIDLGAHSYGGVVAAKLLPHLGGRVRSLFLYEPVLFGALAEDRASDHEAIREAQEFLAHPWFLHDPERGGTDEWLEVFIDYWNRPGSWKRMPEELRAMTREFGWKMFKEVRSCFLTPQAWGDLAVSMPLTLAMGTRSPKTSRAMVKAIADRCAHAKIVELEGLGHMGPLSHPGLVHDAIRRHLEAIP